RGGCSYRPASCASAGFMQEHRPRCESGVKPQPPPPPPSHPGRVLLPSGVLRQPRFHVGAPPSVRKRSQTPTTAPAPFAPGAGAPTLPSTAPAGVSCRSTAPVRKRSQTTTPEPAPFAPGAGTVRGPAPALVYVGAPPTVRNGAKPQPPSPLHSHPGRVRLQQQTNRSPRRSAVRAPVRPARP